jgi:hypothetical protein
MQQLDGWILVVVRAYADESINCLIFVKEANYVLYKERTEYLYTM